MAKYYVPTEGVESWRKLLAEPDKHWKSGNSAKSLAYCWEEAQGFPKSVVDVFLSSPYELFHSIEFILGSLLRILRPRHTLRPCKYS